MFSLKYENDETHRERRSAVNCCSVHKIFSLYIPLTTVHVYVS